MATKRNRQRKHSRDRRPAKNPPLADVSAQADHRPLIWQLRQKFQVVTNVRQASVTDEIGIVCLELEGDTRRHQGCHQVVRKKWHQSRAGRNQRDRELSAEG